MKRGCGRGPHPRLFFDCVHVERFLARRIRLHIVLSLLARNLGPNFVLFEAPRFDFIWVHRPLSGVFSSAAEGSSPNSHQGTIAGPVVRAASKRRERRRQELSTSVEMTHDRGWLPRPGLG